MVSDTTGVGGHGGLEPLLVSIGAGGPVLANSTGFGPVLGATVVKAVAGHDFADRGNDRNDGSGKGNASLPQRGGFHGVAPDSRITVGVAAEVFGQTISSIFFGSISMHVGYLGRPFLARFA